MSDRANVLGPSHELAKILAENSNEVNQDELRRASHWLLVFEDEVVGSQYADLKKLKLKVLKMAIEDVAGQAQILCDNTIGVTCVDNQLQTFFTPFGSLTLGTIVYKLGIKSLDSFIKRRQSETTDLTQDDVNSVLYTLVYEWSKLLK